jgi:tetratricopeptide (TPR) repeat protein
VDARDPAAARACLAQAVDVGLAPWQLLRAARLYQGADAPAECVALLAETPGFAADAAVCAALAGKPRLAEALAAAALGDAPGDLSAALTLGALLERRGKRADAAKVYARALDASPLPAEHELRRVAQKARLLALGRGSR